MIHIMRRRKTALNIKTSRAKVSPEVKLLQRASQSDYFLRSVERQSIGMEEKMLCLICSFIMDNEQTICDQYIEMLD